MEESSPSHRPPRINTDDLRLITPYWYMLKMCDPKGSQTIVSRRWAERKFSFQLPCICIDIKQFNFIVVICWRSADGKNFVSDITECSPIMIVNWIWMIRIVFAIITKILHFILSKLHLLYRSEILFHYLVIITWSIFSFHYPEYWTSLVRHHQIEIFHKHLHKIHLGVHLYVSIHSRQSYWSEMNNLTWTFFHIMSNTCLILLWLPPKTNNSPLSIAEQEQYALVFGPIVKLRFSSRPP